MGARLPFTKTERRRATHSRQLAYRPTNDWGAGDLPAPWAEGDVVYIDEAALYERHRGQRPGYFVVSYACSIDEGDAWYFRVWDGVSDIGSDRLHVAFAARSSFEEDCDWMAGARLVETDDPDGLALREKMLAGGWQWPAPKLCPTCGTRLAS